MGKWGRAEYLTFISVNSFFEFFGGSSPTAAGELSPDSVAETTAATADHSRHHELNVFCRYDVSISSFRIRVLNHDRREVSRICGWHSTSTVCGFEALVAFHHFSFLSCSFPRWPCTSLRRMWRFYLLSCAGAFRARSLQVFSILFSKEATGIGSGVCDQTQAASSSRLAVLEPSSLL